MKLSDFVESEGYRFVVDPHPGRRPDALGNPKDPDAFDAMICRDKLIACRADCWDYAFACAHEIAEHVYGHVHSENMFSYQANIMAGWLKDLASGI